MLSIYADASFELGTFVTMDIVLEFVDTFIADYTYAYLFPIGLPHKAEVNDSAQLFAPYVSQHETGFFHVQPSQAAYMSLLTRNNPYRQSLTLFFIAW